MVICISLVFAIFIWIALFEAYKLKGTIRNFHLIGE